MAGRLPVPRHRALGWGLAVALMVPLAWGPASAGATTAAELAQARTRIDRTSAELAAARTAADGLGGAEREALERIERRLQRQKDALLRLEAGLSARHAEESAAADDASAPADEETPAADDSAAPEGPVVRLAERPSADVVAATPSLSPGIQRSDEVVPAVAGDDAAQASRIDGYLASKFSPLTGLGAVFVTESRAVGLDPRFLVAIAGSETSFGTYGPSQAIHNPFGMGPGINYPSWATGIRAAAQNLGGSIYLGDGRVTIVAIRDRWAPAGAANDPTGLNSNWVRNVSTYFSELGGDPSGSVFPGRAVPTLPAGAVPAAVPGGVAGAPVAYAPAAPAIGMSGRGPSAAESALAMLGAPTVAHGAGPERGFDAAGLVRWAYAEHGVDAPRKLAAQAAAGRRITPAELDSGDVIVFAGESGEIVHAGLYVGGGQFVHAPGAGDVVRLSSLYEPYYAESYAGARRY